MKARTILERRIMALSTPSITKEQRAWAIRECLPHLGYATKSNVFCLDCGKSFDTSMIRRNKAICPHCDTRLKIEFTRKTTHNFTSYFAITYIVDEFQVVAHYELKANYSKCRKVKIILHRILEDWIQLDGKCTMKGLQHHYSGNMDCWSGEWQIRKEKKWRYYNSYEVYPDKYAPGSKFKPEYRKIGINRYLEGLGIKRALRYIPQYPIAETLVKAKQFSLLNSFASSQGEVNRNWPSIKICIRNKYKVMDAGIWMDYLDLLRHFGKDLHNAKYVCPRNLQVEHDRLAVKKAAIDRALEAEEERMRVEKRKKDLKRQEREFKMRIKPFVGWKVAKGKLVLKVLDSLKEFQFEGEALNHCVFANAYYGKKDSLILSARIDDQPVETVEVSLSQMKIIQARGLNNNPTAYHNKILSLTREALPAIKKIVNQKTA